MNSIITVTSFIILSIGILGIVFKRRNTLIILMCIELMLLASNINFIFFAALFDDCFGQIIAMYVLTIAAAESAIGLSIFTLFFKNKKTAFLDDFILLRG